MCVRLKLFHKADFFGKQVKCHRGFFVCLKHRGDEETCVLLTERFCCALFIFLKILFIYPWEMHRERQRHRQREKQAPCGEPDVGLDPRTPRSPLEPKALSHRATQASPIFYTFKLGRTDVEGASFLGPVLLTDVFCIPFTFTHSTTVFTLLPKLKSRVISKQNFGYLDSLEPLEAPAISGLCFHVMGTNIYWLPTDVRHGSKCFLPWGCCTGRYKWYFFLWLKELA